MEGGNNQVLRDCQINEWLPDFQHLSYKTLWLHLPEDFVDFLVSDGIYASASSKAVTTASFIPLLSLYNCNPVPM